MSYTIALNFEDDVTRFINCRENETVLDAAFRHQINLPMDCTDGVCGTCKCRCEQGEYDLGDEYLDDALDDKEAEQRYVLTCQMVPDSACVIDVPLASTACKTGNAEFTATLAGVTPYQDAALEVAFDIETEGAKPGFLPGQYVNIGVPEVEQTRSYSFSSRPGSARLTFLIKRVSGGLMSRYLDRAKPGDELAFTGPMGAFYLRDIQRPVLMLAGGTGLAPFLAMLETLTEQPPDQPVHMVYGVTRDQDLVLVDRLEAFAERIPHFTFTTCVADPESQHPRTGYVMDHLDPEVLYDGDVDVYVCGPPPMVDAVRAHFGQIGVAPANFRYEKFAPKDKALESEA